MKIYQRQLDVMSLYMLEKFIIKLTERIIKKYPDWETKYSFNEKNEIIKNILEYANKINITEEENLIKFAEIIIQQKKMIPLPIDLLIELKNATKNESEKIDLMYISMASNRKNLTIIKL